MNTSELNMELTIHTTTSSKVHLTDQQVDEITIKRLRQLVHPGEYLRDTGQLVFLARDEEHHHGSVYSENVRAATTLDKAVFRVLDFLKDKQ